mmetsp:Transcript_31643/g.94665  ORF Transcript_31643/g.94665 Transcript_31643/m.94665 type:complete len:313 (-) Transcript_31643:74-1012(-)
MGKISHWAGFLSRAISSNITVKSIHFVLPGWGRISISICVSIRHGILIPGAFGLDGIAIEGICGAFHGRCWIGMGISIFIWRGIGILRPSGLIRSAFHRRRWGSNGISISPDIWILGVFGMDSIPIGIINGTFHRWRRRICTIIDIGIPTQRNCIHCPLKDIMRSVRSLVAITAVVGIVHSTIRGRTGIGVRHCSVFPFRGIVAGDTGLAIVVTAGRICTMLRRRLGIGVADILKSTRSRGGARCLHHGRIVGSYRITLRGWEWTSVVAGIVAVTRTRGSARRLRRSSGVVGRNRGTLRGGRGIGAAAITII